MGIHGIYQEIGRGERIALSKLAVEKFEETGRPLRIAIDVSIWLFQIQASKGGTNPAPRTFYYRLLRLISLSINPIFVFDGPNKPPFKRGKRTGANVSSIPDFMAKQLIKQFGFPIHYAPGEAEAECALLQREGIVDAVLSEDVDTLMFGSGITIRNWSPELKSSKTPTHVNVFDAVKTKSGPAGLDREGMILVALMSGGDYVPEGIPGCGPKTACEAARAGFGERLCNIRPTDKAALQSWKESLQHELKTNESKQFKRKHPSMKIPEDFPRLDILRYYTHPVVSTPETLDKLRRTMKWDQELDFPGLRTFTHDAFDWIKLEGAKHFIRSLAPTLLVRGLRLRAENAGDRFAPDDPVAIKEDEAMLVKGIHGKRQHPVTDNTPELRVSFTPIELVKIDLSQEEPDEVPSTQNGLAAGSYADNSGEAELDMVDIEDDDDDGPKKRGPTKFDPNKPARVWVLETFVKQGVPLTAEDWEAGRRIPKKAASKPTTKAAPKAKAVRRTKTAGDMPQGALFQYAKVTKPGTKLLSKADKPPQQPRAASQPPKPASKPVVNISLLSSSPPRPFAPAPTRQPKEKSLSPVIELPSSVTKRRKRGPIQRSRTLPADMGSPLNRPSTPPPADTIDTVNLVSSPALFSPSPLPTKKAKIHTTKDVPISRSTRTKSVTASPAKTRQTTIDTWAFSSPSGTPTKPKTLPASTAPIPAPPKFQTSKDTIDELDFTMSSPAKAPIRTRTKPAIPTTHTTSRQPSPTRPPLQSISSNSSFSSTSSTSNSRPASKAPVKRRTSPRLRKTVSAFEEVEEVDLTLSSPPPAAKNNDRSRTSSSSSFTFTNPLPRTANSAIPTDTHSSRTSSSSSSSFTFTKPFPPAKSKSKSTAKLNTARSVSPPPPTPATDQPLRRSPRTSTSSSTSPQAPWKARQVKKVEETTRRKRELFIRKSGVAEYRYRDDEVQGGNGNGVVLKGKERRAWRESGVVELDFT